jgi:peptidoglycan/LPS O-acetylase OafA/YrhL
MTAMLETMPEHADSDVPRPPDPNPEHNPRRYRPDIEGLRAVAVVLVVLYHAKLLGITGGYVGVDVFFVISGFLITRQLVAGIDMRGARELPGFYARRIRRLLPASCLVAVTTIVAAWYWAPVGQARQIFTDAIFTTFYGLNYRLAYNGTQYLHQGDQVSPLQHFWSLGVEEQFYVIWPLVIILCMLLPQRARLATLAVTLSMITGISLYLSITTSAGSTWAYFGLHTRAWEMAVGGLVALASPLCARLPRRLTGVGAWLGVAAIFACAWTLTDDTIYPGSAALVPVLACAFVIACGTASRHHSIERLFAEPAIQGIGKISYSWYLWHWPMLVLIPLLADHPLNWVRRLEIVLLSLLFAVLTYHALENPARKLRRLNFEWIRTGLALAGIVIGAAVVAGNILPAPVKTGVRVTTTTLATNTKTTRQEAKLISAAQTQKIVPDNLQPSVEHAPTDFAIGCIISTITEDQGYKGRCSLGDPKGKVTIGVFGDSHAHHWTDGLDKAAKQIHAKVIVRTKAACPPDDVPVYVRGLNGKYRPYTECDAWRPKAIAELISLHPDYIFMSGSDAVGAGTKPTQWQAGMERTVRAFTSQHIKVLFIKDTPFINEDVPECVGAHPRDVTVCATPRARAFQFPDTHAAAAKGAAAGGATVVDPLNWLCGKKTCPAVVGNILVYRDDEGHMTARMSAWLSPVLANTLTHFQKAEKIGTST